MRLLGVTGWWLAACSFTPAGGVDAGPGSDAVTAGDWLPGFTFRRAVRFDGLTVTSTDLPDFVTLVSTLADPHLAQHARGDGTGFAVTAVDGVTPLGFEVEAFAAATGALALWTAAPTGVDGTAAYLYYGGAATAPAGPPTWAPSTFAAVWHLSDPSADAATDSTGGTPLSSVTSIAPDLAPGLVATARSFADDGDDHLLTAATTSAPLPGSFSYAAWVLVSTSIGSFDVPLHTGGTSALQPGFDFELGTGGWVAGVSDGAEIQTASLGSERLGAWTHLVAVVDRERSQLRTYVDGALQASRPLTVAAISPASPLSLGADLDANYPFAGLIDEARLYRHALDDDWIAAEHRNLTRPSQVVLLGLPEPAR
ncbi:MAG: LamG domain-containing protein [Kofleriaceae bacterium]|nr:LamG domain-containing protein [Kofleriaceae bacterium]